MINRATFLWPAERFMICLCAWHVPLMSGPVTARGGGGGVYSTKTYIEKI